MKLYNTLSRKIENFEPINPPQVGVYACGPTVYDYTHLGHLRKYVMDDVLVRTLKHAGFKVKHVMNITDVGHLASDDDAGEDKLEKGAKKYQLTVWDLAKKFEKFFFSSLEKINIKKQDVVERVTDCIQEQINLVKKLEEKGFTYEISGDGIYFDTSKLADYGKLARLDIKNLKAGVRVAVAGKKNITDFALWKYERPGENRQMVWSSPWSEKGFPGWHIECSVISMKNLGEQIDIHTGGIDHIPVHHTNEIAQSEAATGKKPFVRYWVHHNFLRVENEKMSKSLGNFYTIEDITKKGFSPQALRLLFLSAHYRSELNFTCEALAAAQKAWERLIKQIQNPKFKVKNKQDNDNSVQAQSYKKRFFDDINNDLKTPEALAVMWQVLADKKLKDDKKLSLLLEFDEVLGLGLEKEIKKEEKRPKRKNLPAELEELLKKREKARKAEDWQQSDKLRTEVEKLGFMIEDINGEQKLIAIIRS